MSRNQYKMRMDANRKVHPVDWFQLYLHIFYVLSGGICGHSILIRIWGTSGSQIENIFSNAYQSTDLKMFPELLFGDFHSSTSQVMITAWRMRSSETAMPTYIRTQSKKNRQM